MLICSRLINRCANGVVIYSVVAQTLLVIHIVPRPNIRGVEKAELLWTKRGWRLRTEGCNKELLRSVFRPWPIRMMAGLTNQLVQARSGRVYLVVESSVQHRSPETRGRSRARAVGFVAAGLIAALTTVGVLDVSPGQESRGASPLSSSSSSSSAYSPNPEPAPRSVNPCAIPLQDLEAFQAFLAKRTGYQEVSVSQIGGLRMVVILQDCESLQETRRLTFTEKKDEWKLKKVSR